MCVVCLFAARLVYHHALHPLFPSFSFSFCLSFSVSFSFSDSHSCLLHTHSSINLSPVPPRFFTLKPMLSSPVCISFLSPGHGDCLFSAPFFVSYLLFILFTLFHPHFLMPTIVPIAVRVSNLALHSSFLQPFPFSVLAICTHSPCSLHMFLSLFFLHVFLQMPSPLSIARITISF